MLGETDTSPSTPEDTEDDEVTSIMSPCVPPDTIDDMVPKATSPSETCDAVLCSRPQTPTLEVVPSNLNSMQIQDAPMDDLTDRQSDTSSETASSISAHIVKA